MEIFPEKNVIQKSWAAKKFFGPPNFGARSPPMGAIQIFDYITYIFHLSKISSLNSSYIRDNVLDLVNNIFHLLTSECIWGYSSVAEHSTADREVAGSTPAAPWCSLLQDAQFAHSRVHYSVSSTIASSSNDMRQG